MKKLANNNLELINGGGDIANGLCGGLIAAEGVGAFAGAVATYGWFGVAAFAIPGLGQGLAIIAIAGAATCAYAAIDN